MTAPLWTYRVAGRFVRPLQGAKVVSCLFSPTHRVIPDRTALGINLSSIKIDIMVYIMDEALIREVLSSSAATGEHQA